MNETLAFKAKQQKSKLLKEVAIAAVLALLVAFVMPAILPDFYRKLLGRFLSLAIVAMGVDLIWGYTGILSLGQGIFFALGGYALAMHLNLQTKPDQIPDFFSLYGVTELPWIWKPFYSFPLTILAIFIIPAVIAGLLGYLVFRNRIKGVYFSILSQAALLVFFNFFNGQQKLINGTNGLKTDTEKIFGVLAGTEPVQVAFFQFTVLFLFLIYFLCRWLTSGRFGRVLTAIRDDEVRVRFSGYDPTWYKVVVFAISGMLAGIAGALYTVQTGIINPDTMAVPFSIEMVIWVAVGGRATLIGAIVGTLLVQFGRSFLSQKFPDIWLFFQGALFLLVVTVFPDGIIGIIKSLSTSGRKQAATYPSLDEDPEVKAEEEEIAQK